MGIPSGILLQKVGYKKTALIAVAIILGVVIVIGSYLVAAGITVYILYLIFVI